MHVRPAARLVVGLALALVSGSLLGTGAVAAPVWTPPQQLDATGVAATLAGNGRGDAVAVWTISQAVFAATRSAGGPWSTAKRLEGTCETPCGGSILLEPHAVIDDAGRATVSWGELEPGPNDGTSSQWSFVASHDATGWSTPLLLTESSYLAPSLAVGADGTVTAAWSDGVSQPPVVQVATGSPDGGWSTPENVGPGSWDVGVVSATDGTVTLVYESNGHVVATRRPGNGAWGQPVELATASSIDGEPQVVVDGEGALTASWSSCTWATSPPVCQVQAAHRPASGPWGPTLVLDESSTVRQSELAVADDGAVTAVWSSPSSSSQGGPVLSARRTPAGWGPVEALSADSSTAHGASVATDHLGNTVATWYTSAGDGTSTVEAAHRPVGGVWEPATVGTPGWSPYVAALGQDVFTTLYSRQEGTYVSDRVDDVTPPTARLTRPITRFQTRTPVRVAWTLHDDLAGIATVVVRKRAARYDGAFGDWSVWRRVSATNTGTTLKGLPGRTYCFSVRPVDRAGNRGSWTRTRCTTTPVDDRTATASSGWRRITREGAYRHTETVTRQRGSRLVLPGVRARSLQLLTTLCSGCGTVSVSLGGHHLRTVSLQGYNWRNLQLVPVASFRRVRTGTLVVRVVSSGKKVSIDGIAVRR